MNAGSPLNEIMALRAALAQAEARADAAEADAAQAKAKASSDQAFIAYLKLEIEKLRRDLYGVRSERKARLLDQLELQLEELEATTSEDELAAERAAAKTTAVETFSRRKPVRKPFPLPRERVVVPAPTSCPCCGSDKLCKLGETVTETLESIPRQWKVIQTVRERFSCRTCETITQPPAPFHTIPRAWAGLLAMVLFEKAPAAEPAVRALRP
jgi:transposase